MKCFSLKHFLFVCLLETFENHNRTIINYFKERLTNASAESFNAKIKALRSQFKGVYKKNDRVLTIFTRYTLG
ncbi:hypothetical protein D0T60_16225 [Bacteroides sp. 224]|nr:transposase [Bacteroides sp. 224]NDV66770.1 hypothetical protein [Bacteroides sp. 224]